MKYERSLLGRSCGDPTVGDLGALLREFRVLVLEDRRADAELMLHELRQAGVRWVANQVETEADFLNRLRDFAPDLILADHVMPGYSGLAALASARQLRPETPFVLVSGCMREEEALQALRLGAAEYVCKDELFRLQPVLHNVLRQIAEHRLRQQSEAQLAVFAALGAGLSSAPTARAAAEVVLDAADQLFGWDAGTLELYDQQTNRLQQVLNLDKAGGRRGERASACHSAAPSPRAWRALKEGAQLVLRGDAAAGASEALGVGEASRRSASTMLAPVRRGQQVLGLLCIHSSAPNAYDASTLKTFQALADHCAGALERISAQEALSRSEEQLRSQAALLDAASDAIHVEDLRGRIRFWNRSASRLYGWSVEEALERESDAVLGLMAPRSLAEPRQAALQHGAWAGELRPRTKAGREVTVRSRWTLVRSREGAPHRFLVVSTDLTGQKRLEAQLLRAQRLESIGRMASGIAHDLNNVLTPVIIAVQLLQETCRTDSERALLRTLQSCAQRGAAIVQQVLLFARGAEGARVLLQPRQLLQEMGRLVKETFSKSLSLELAFPQDLPPIRAEHTQMQQVLMNLCLNARDAMPAGGTLKLEAGACQFDAATPVHPKARPGRYAVLKVSDTGTGIRPEVLEHMFDPFFTTKPAGQGTGLGLPMVLSIVESHGGFITVESKVGAGSSFAVYLPAADALEATAVAPA